MQSPCESAEMSKHEREDPMLGSLVGSSRIERAAVRWLPRARQRLAWTDMNFEFMKRARKHPPHRLPVRGEVEGHGNAGSL